VGRKQPSSPSPLLPSKKQSCSTGSTLSPGTPVAKLSSRSSSGPVHSGSAPSIRPSSSSSMQLLHWGPPSTQPIGGVVLPSPPPPPPPPPPSSDGLPSP